MKRRILTIIYILIVSVIYGQTKENTIFVGNVISDTTTFKSNAYWTTLNSILQSNYKIEIRFISSPSSFNMNYTILTYDKKWNAKCYYYDQNENAFLAKDIKSQAKIDTIFSRLVLNNIFSLPDQDNLIKKNYEYNPETNELIKTSISIYEGICYYVEFKVGDHYRRYSYCNPDSYADYFSQVYELRNFANIVEIFNELTCE